MRRALVDRLACPQCRGSIEIAEVVEETPVRIMHGTLRCKGCRREYPVEKGVPRLVVQVAEEQAEVCRRFSFQWFSRWKGKFEGSRCYGFHDIDYIGWVNDQMQTRREAEPGEWMLDCGCGSGEKSATLARLCPEQNIVGLDLGVASQEMAIARFGDMPNLDYVQGDIMNPPIKERQFDYGMSLGVLHHTPNTRQALASFRRMLKEQASCVIWIYPPYREGPEWWVGYFARDYFLMGQGPKLPTWLVRGLAKTVVFMFFPIIDYTFKRSYRRIHKDLPFFDADRMTIKERYNAQVFFGFDTCLPKFQHRHSIKEVEGWLVEEGMDPILNAHSFYTASSVPAPTVSKGLESEAQRDRDGELDATAS